MLHASCHCGAVTLEISDPPLELTDCNCSICRRYGALWAYFTRKDVRIACAEPDILAAYSWGDRRIEFNHCRRCGCVVFHERTEKRGQETRLGINARMMDPKDIVSIRVRRLDGASTWEYLD